MNTQKKERKIDLDFNGMNLENLDVVWYKKS